MVTAERSSTEQPVSDYLQRLDLGAEPLAGTTDYFYAGAERRNVLDQIVHYCRFSEQLVVLTAAPGSGKTTLVDATVVQLNSIIDCCRILATDISSSETIINTLGRILHLPLSSPSTKGFLDSLSQRTVVDGELEPVLVIVEQAESLSLAQLENLVKLHEMARSSMHLLLVGAKPLQRRIDKIAIENPNIKQFSLRPLTLAELESYTLSRLQSVGYKGEQPFSQDQLVVLHEQSGGIIAEVNRMMPLLLEGGLQQTSAAKRKFLPKVHMLVLSLLFLLLFAALIFEFGMETNVPEIASNPDGRASLELPVNLPARRVEREPGPILAREVPVPDPVFAEKPLVQEPLVQEPLVEEPLVEAPLAQETLAAPSQSGLEPVSAPEPSIPVAAAPQLKTAPPKPVAKQPAVKTIKPAQSEQPVAALSARDQRLLAMDASHFMLQVLGSSNEQAVRDYVKQYVAQLPLSYFETQMRGKPWYVVIVGPYATRELAQRAVQGFPSDLQKQSPWVRSVASVQSDIKARLRL